MLLVTCTRCFRIKNLPLEFITFCCRFILTFSDDGKPCTPYPCGKNAICSEEGGKAVCQCQPGFVGEPFDECKKPTKRTAKPGSVVLQSSGDKVRLLPAEPGTHRFIGDRLGNGQQLGEYEVAGSYDGRTFYKQRDTLRYKQVSPGNAIFQRPSVLAFDGSGPKLFGYCLGECGRWYVGFEVGRTSNVSLRNVQETPTPPMSGWELSRQGNWTKDDGVTLREGALESCRVVMIHGHGETARLWGSSFGAYTPTDDWSFGRPVYQKATPPTRYLMVDGDSNINSGIWAVKSSPEPGTDVVGWYLTSFNAPNRPATSETDEWQHWSPTENKIGSGQWVKADLRVHCPFEMPPLTPASSWPPSVVLSTGAARSHLSGEYKGSVGTNYGGEYKLQESYNGRPLYVQQDTIGTKTIYLFFYNDGEFHAWHFGDLLGRSQGWFYNPSNSTNVPSNRWRTSTGTTFVDAPSVTVQMGNLEPCKEVRVSALKGKQHVVRSVGVYRPTGRWSSGRPVYRQVEPPRLYLLVAESRATWSTRISPDSPLAWMDSDSTENSPGDPGKWVHSGDTELRDDTNTEEEKREVGWKDGGITVACN